MRFVVRLIQRQLSFVSTLENHSRRNDEQGLRSRAKSLQNRSLFTQQKIHFLYRKPARCCPGPNHPNPNAQPDTPTDTGCWRAPPQDRLHAETDRLTPGLLTVFFPFVCSLQKANDDDLSKCNCSVYRRVLVPRR